MKQGSLQETPALLDLLVEELGQIEGHLGAGSGEPDPNSATAAIQSLRASHVWLGDPAANFYEIPSIRAGEAAYLIRLPMGLQPARGAQFSRIECNCEFDSEGDEWKPQLAAVFPEHRFVTLLEYERELKLGIDESFGWALPDLTKLLEHSEDFKTTLAAEIGAKAKVHVPKLQYRLGRAEIHATGVGQRAFWRIDTPTLREESSVEFLMIVRTPVSCKEFSLQCTFAAYPTFTWLTARIGDLFERLSDRLKALLRVKGGEPETAGVLPIGEHQPPVRLLTASARKLA